MNENSRKSSKNTSSKSPKLEDKAAVIARIKEATKYIPLERLAKIALIKEIADEVWG